MTCTDDDETQKMPQIDWKKLVKEKKDIFCKWIINHHVQIISILVIISAMIPMRWISDLENKIILFVIAIVVASAISWKFISGKEKEIMLILAALATLFAAISTIYSNIAIQEASEGTKLAIENNKLSESNLNKTTEIAEWYYNPKPQLIIWTDADYENKSGFVFVDEWIDYVRGNGFNISQSTYVTGYSGVANSSAFNVVPGYLACCKNIKISIYNAGRGSAVFPLISFGLKAIDKNEEVIFKVHTVRTPIDILKYDPIKKYMFQSIDFIEDQQALMPYTGESYKGEIIEDFPPYLDENGYTYFVPPLVSEKYSEINYPIFGKRSDVLGPFRIGTIPPGQTAEIELKIFAAKGRLAQREKWKKTRDTFSFLPDTKDSCKEGLLNITVRSLNTETINRSINLKVGSKDLCYDRPIASEEYVKSLTNRSK